MVCLPTVWVLKMNIHLVCSRKQRTKFLYIAWKLCKLTFYCRTINSWQSETLFEHCLLLYSTPIQIYSRCCSNMLQKKSLCRKWQILGHTYSEPKFIREYLYKAKPKTLLEPRSSLHSIFHYCWLQLKSPTLRKEPVIEPFENFFSSTTYMVTFSHQ